MQFAGECPGRAIVNYALDFSGFSCLNIYPRATGGLENAGEGTEAVPGMLAFVSIPEYGYFPVAVLSFQGGFII